MNLFLLRDVVIVYLEDHRAKNAHKLFYIVQCFVNNVSVVCSINKLSTNCNYTTDVVDSFDFFNRFLFLGHKSELLFVCSVFPHLHAFINTLVSL